mgnify:CR=1 FL=1
MKMNIKESSLPPINVKNEQLKFKKLQTPKQKPVWTPKEKPI